jgi:hypothetical protein
MSSSPKKLELPEIKLKRLSSTASSSAQIQKEFQKVKVLNTGDKGIFTPRWSADVRMTKEVTWDPGCWDFWKPQFHYLILMGNKVKLKMGWAIRGNEKVDEWNSISSGEIWGGSLCDLCWTGKVRWYERLNPFTQYVAQTDRKRRLGPENMGEPWTLWSRNSAAKSMHGWYRLALELRIIGISN